MIFQQFGMKVAIGFSSSIKIFENTTFFPLTIMPISKLDDLGTHLRLFELLFDDILADMTVSYVKFHGHREQAYTSFEITNEVFRLFGGMLLSGCHKLPHCKIYQETTLDKFVKTM